MRRTNSICSALCVLVVLCGHVRADDSDSDDTIEKITARKLFLEGRELLNRAQTSEACSALERSRQLHQTLAALLNLGLCYKALGRVVTAHDYYREAEVQATLHGDASRREFAHDEAASLAALRATLTLRIAGAKDTDLEVLVDNKPQPREIWNHPIFLDSGEHRVVVRSQTDQTWESSVMMVDGGKHFVIVPAFAGSPRSTEVPTQVVDTLAPPPPLELEETRPWLTSTRVVALGAGVAGAGALVASLIYAIHAKSTWNDSNSRGCERASNLCSSQGLQLREDARADATRSTVCGIGGGVAVLGGLVLWLVDPARPETRASLSLSISPDAVAAAWSGAL